MFALLAWLLVVYFFYFRQTDSLFEYVAFLAQNRGSVHVWRPFMLKALGGTAVALWIAWVAVRSGGYLLSILAAQLEISDRERLVFSAALGFGAIALVTLALGALHLWYTGIFAIGLGAAGFMGRLSKSEPPTGLRPWLGLFRRYAADPGMKPAATSLLLLLAFLIFLVGDLSPEVFYDSLHYHLAVPNLYLLNHRIIDPPTLAYSGLIASVQMVWGFAITVGNEITAKLLHGLTAVLLLLTFLAFEDRYFARGSGTFGALIFLSTPLVGMNITTAGIDVAWTALQVVATLALVRVLTESQEPAVERQWLCLAGLLTGLAASCKYTGLPAIPIACCLLLWRKRRLAPFLVPALLMVMPYLVKNIVFHHNPVYPFGGTLLGEPRLTSLDWQNISKETRPRNLVEDFSRTSSFAEFVFHPALITMKGRTGMDFVGPVFLGLLPLVLLARPPGAAYALLARYALGFWVVWRLTTLAPRFAMPFLAMFSLLAAHALVSVSESSVVRRMVYALCLLGIATNLYFTFFFNANSENWRVLMGQMSERDYLSDRHPTYPAPSFEAFEWMNANLSAGSKVLIAGDSRSYHTRTPVVPSSTFNTQPIIEIVRLAHDGSDMARLLREQGITHIFVNFAEAVRTESYGPFPFDAHNWPVFEDFWSHHVELIWVSYRPDPGNLKGLFVFKVGASPSSAPPPNPFERWKPK